MRIRRSTANIAATQLYAFLYVQLLMALFHPPQLFLRGYATVCIWRFLKSIAAVRPFLVTLSLDLTGRRFDPMTSRSRENVLLLSTKQQIPTSMGWYLVFSYFIPLSVKFR